MKKSTYGVMVYCPALQEVTTYNVLSSQRESAARFAENKFLREFPQVLERGLTFGTKVRLGEWSTFGILLEHPAVQEYLENFRQAILADLKRRKIGSIERA